VLLDYGLPDASLFRADYPPADLVICSHAHADHGRGLLALHQMFPDLPIYASEVTTQLLPLNWVDQVDQTVPLFAQALPWRSPVEFLDGLTAELFPAGHLPGAAVILLTYTSPQDSRAYRVLYTGDFFLSNSRLVEGLRLEEIRGRSPDVLILEGSYGTARYPHRRQQENQLAERISQAIAEGRSVLLPLPTLGLGQELLMLLRSHHLFTGKELEIWVDGAIADGCDAYLELLPHFPAAVQNFARHQPLFWDDRVRPRVKRLDPTQRSRLGQTPCIVLTDLTVDWQDFCRDQSRWLILLPQDVPEIFTSAERLNQMAEVLETYLLAQHCDGPSTTQLIHNVRPQHVVFVHGSPTYLADLAGLDELNHRYHLHAPSAGTLVELPIGETFLQPAPPETTYEGELAERESVITITLPESAMNDPRWRSLSDTGVVEARWQGQELVLRGLTQRELTSQSDRAVVTNKDCCFSCRHYRGQRCWNPGSPLFNFKVTPEGYCPVFESSQVASTP
jgi:Cft2 family RNA processing exonuclease